MSRTLSFPTGISRGIKGAGRGWEVVLELQVSSIQNQDQSFSGIDSV
jgi:hypothetical protein